MFKYLALALAFGMTLAACANANDALHSSATHAATGLQVDHAWARALPPSVKTGAVYVHIHNQTETDDTLESVQTPIAEAVELHTVEKVDEVMKMVQLKEIRIAAQEHLMLAPSAHHLMLFGLKQHLTSGTTFPLTLHFTKAGAIEVNVSVIDQPQTTPDHSHHH